ncbi:MAG: M15 family metallopeptidase, partial [Bacilli bacterium]|nr:M15 family metallopeptidase [Bacilli bacterium]
EKNINKYINYLKENDNIDGIIKYVNNYNEYDIEINTTTLSFITEKYFIIDYLDRYLKYYENNKNLDFKEIITRVNSNLDYEFYTDSKESNLTKGMYTLVNKYNYLDKNYVPDNLVSVTGIYARDKAQLVDVAYNNFVKMADDARKENLTIKVTTGYRSYNFQSTLYNNYVKADGIKNADTYSARPGYSEHQLGYSADLTNAKNVSFDDFEYTNEYKWLQQNAYKYGFIMRYPKDKEYITGYMFESWHYRYVGVEIATYIYENNITYEEYYEYYLR